MKKQTLFLSVLAITVSLLCTSCINMFAKEIKGDGKLVTKTINISSFSQVEIETYADINYSQGKNTGKLEITVDQNLWEYYDIHTKGDVLHIKLKEEYRNSINPHPTKCLITVSSEQLNSIENAGSSKFNFCTAFKSSELSIDLAGSGKVLANKYPVTIGECSIDIAGSGTVKLKGTVEEGEIDIAGSGSVDALDCKFKQLSVDLAGSGNVEAYVTDELEVDIAGSGKVKYKGNPKISTDIAGSGKVVKL
jgi:hypothetical protein